MAFDQDIDELVQRLNLREIDPAQAAEIIKGRVREELGARATGGSMSGLEGYIDASCQRQFGGDADDKSMQRLLIRQIKRLGRGRLAAPQEDGQVVWI